MLYTCYPIYIEFSKQSSYYKAIKTKQVPIQNEHRENYINNDKIKC